MGRLNEPRSTDETQLLLASADLPDDYTVIIDKRSSHRGSSCVATILAPPSAFPSSVAPPLHFAKVFDVVGVVLLYLPDQELPKLRRIDRLWKSVVDEQIEQQHGDLSEWNQHIDEYNHQLAMVSNNSGISDPHMIPNAEWYPYGFMYIATMVSAVFVAMLGYSTTVRIGVCSALGVVEVALFAGLVGHTASSILLRMIVVNAGLLQMCLVSFLNLAIANIAARTVCCLSFLWFVSPLITTPLYNMRSRRQKQIAQVDEPCSWWKIKPTPLIIHSICAKQRKQNNTTF